MRAEGKNVYPQRILYFQFLARYTEFLEVPIFLSVMKGAKFGISRTVAIPTNPCWSLRGFREDISNTELVKHYNEAEGYLKRFELLYGEMNTSHIGRVFNAACCIILPESYVGKKSFWLACCSAQILMLWDTLKFVMTSLGVSSADKATVRAKYEQILCEGCNFYDVKSSFLSDIGHYSGVSEEFL